MIIAIGVYAMINNNLFVSLIFSVLLLTLLLFINTLTESYLLLLIGLFVLFVILIVVYILQFKRDFLQHLLYKKFDIEVIEAKLLEKSMI